MQVDPRTQNTSPELLKMLFPEFGRMPELPGVPSQNQAPQLPPVNFGGVVIDNYEPTVTDQQQQELLMNDPRIAQLIRAEAQQAPQQAPRYKTPKNALGIGGNFRDILGHISDTLLGTDQYKKTRKEEDLNRALSGSSVEDPMAAIEELRRSGRGLEAKALYDQMMKDRLTLQKEKAQADRDEAATGIDKQKLFYTDLGSAVGILRGGKGGTPEARARLANMARNHLKSRGVTLPDELAINDNYSDEYLAALENAMIDPEAFARLQEQTSYHDAMIDESRGKREELKDYRSTVQDREERKFQTDTEFKKGKIKIEGIEAAARIRRDNQPIHIRNATQTASGPKGTIYLYKGKWVDKAGREVN